MVSQRLSVYSPAGRGRAPLVRAARRRGLFRRAGEPQLPAERDRGAAPSTHGFPRHPPLAVSDAVIPDQRVPQLRGQGRGVGQGIH